MTKRTDVFLAVLAVGVAMLPDDGFTFDGMTRPVPAPCGTQRASSCTVALVEPYRLPAGLVIPLPLPRPPGLGMENREPADRVCDPSEVCSTYPN